ncbi:MAG: helix-turn-helix transcriptional regulator [Oscillospiraceae bacterium]|nr:helix-turn-helix transcriptional regulator [Oscillospiraceae bacterium]
MIKDLPEKLKLLRVKYGYSQKQVADKVNISPSIISGYETGERTPSTDVLLSLSNIYNCSVDYLLGKQNAEPPVIFDTEGLTDKQIQAIITLIDSMKNK